MPQLLCMSLLCLRLLKAPQPHLFQPHHPTLQGGSVVSPANHYRNQSDPHPLRMSTRHLGHPLLRFRLNHAQGTQDIERDKVRPWSLVSFQGRGHHVIWVKDLISDFLGNTELSNWLVTGMSASEGITITVAQEGWVRSSRLAGHWNRLPKRKRSASEIFRLLGAVEWFPVRSHWFQLKSNSVANILPCNLLRMGAACLEANAQLVSQAHKC